MKGFGLTVKHKGFTLIELLIVLAICAILAAVALPALMDYDARHGMLGKSSTSFGLNGAVEVRCVDGYKHAVGSRGQVSQILDEQGRGMRCGE